MDTVIISTSIPIKLTRLIFFVWVCFINKLLKRCMSIDMKHRSMEEGSKGKCEKTVEFGSVESVCTVKRKRPNNGVVIHIIINERDMGLGVLSYIYCTQTQ